MSLVKGDSVVLSAFDGGFYKPFACALDATLNTDMEMLETSVSGAGLSKTVIPAQDTWDISGTGLVSLVVTNSLTLPELRVIQAARVAILIHFTRTSVTGQTYMDIGYAYIKNVQDTGVFNGMNTFSYSLVGSGPLTQSFVPSPIIPPGTMHKFYISGAGLTSYTMATNKTIMGAWLVSNGDWEVITSGTPAVNQIKYDITTGILSWLIPLEADQVLHIQYQDL